LHDISRDVREEFPSLETFSRWGPGYFCWDEDDGTPGHTLGVVFWRGRGTAHRSVGWGVSVTRGKVLWTVWRWIADEEVDDRRYPMQRVTVRGRLDPEAVVQNVRQHLRKWKVK
jgi:hypothetical protein